jgi:prepilin-type N-terminal cleavage/methylation domain-containing protein
MKMKSGNDKSRGCFKVKEQGFTLVELLIVMTIVGTLAVIATISFNKMTIKSNIESQIKQMHSDLMTARIWAMDRSTCHFVLLKANGSYTVYEDSNNYCSNLTPPDNDTMQLQRTMTNPILFNNAAPTNNVYPIFDNRGLATITGTISIPDTVGAAYDCILIETTRTSMGLMTGGNCVPK